MFLSKGIEVQHLKSWYEPEEEEVMQNFLSSAEETEFNRNQEKKEEHKCRKFE